MLCLLGLEGVLEDPPCGLNMKACSSESLEMLLVLSPAQVLSQPSVSMCPCLSAQTECCVVRSKFSGFYEEGQQF